MFDPSVFGYILPMTINYINHLLQPYADALSHANSVESLIPWIQQVDPQNAPNIINSFGEETLEDCKSFILSDLAAYLDSNSPIEEYRTPWDIATYRSKEAIRLFGEPSKTLPVVVTYGNNAYQHEFTEEMTYGVLVALDGNPNLSVSLFGYVLSRDDLDFLFLIENLNKPDQKYVVNHNNKLITFKHDEFIQRDTNPAAWIEVNPHNIVNDANQKYVVNNNNKLIAFKSNEFIQGVMTAAEWIGVDPHNIINDLRYIDENYNVTRYNF